MHWNFLQVEVTVTNIISKKYEFRAENQYERKRIKDDIRIVS